MRSNMITRSILLKRKTIKEKINHPLCSSLSLKCMNVQKTVHLLPVTFDLAEVINGFLFIEIENFVKKKKCEIMEIIKKSSFSRRDNPDEWWNIEIVESNHIHFYDNMNCTKCSNFVNVSRYSKHRKNMMCSCYDLTIYN